jgi:aspartate aminotransferase
MLPLSSRLAQLRASPTIAMGSLVRRLRAEGRDIIPLANGEPDFVPPENVKRAGIEAIRNNVLKYTDAEGTLALRKALSDKFKKSGIDYPPNQIVVSSGTKPLLHAALMAMTDPGDEVIIPAPFWPSHPDIVRLVGAVPVAVAGSPESRFRLTPELLEKAITARTRALLLNAPSNPTGAAYSRNELQALIGVLKRHPAVWVLTDEIYEHITYEGHSAIPLAALDASFADRVVTTNGFSKGYAMMGWRVGFAGGPPAIMAAISAIVSQLVGCPSSISQEAAVEALTGDQSFVAEFVRVFQQRRDLAVKAINATPGLRCATPEGTFYLFVECSGVMGRRLPNGKVIETDEDFVMGAIEFAGVATVHGSVFGLSPFFRISYALDTGQLEEAMRRLNRFCTELVGAG